VWRERERVRKRGKEVRLVDGEEWTNDVYHGWIAGDVID
jgi:hypothetical protein